MLRYEERHQRTTLDESKKKLKSKWVVGEWRMDIPTLGARNLFCSEIPSIPRALQKEDRQQLIVRETASSSNNKKKCVNNIASIRFQG